MPWSTTVASVLLWRNVEREREGALHSRGFPYSLDECIDGVVCTQLRVGAV